MCLNERPCQHVRNRRTILGSFDSGIAANAIGIVKGQFVQEKRLVIRPATVIRRYYSSIDERIHHALLDCEAVPGRHNCLSFDYKRPLPNVNRAAVQPQIAAQRPRAIALLGYRQAADNVRDILKSIDGGCRIAVQRQRLVAIANANDAFQAQAMLRGIAQTCHPLNGHKP